MALSAKKWNEVIATAQGNLDGDWVVVGKGRATILMRSSPNWWAQFIYREESSAGKLVAYQGLLAKNLDGSALGTGGVYGAMFRVPGRRDGRVRWSV